LTPSESEVAREWRKCDSFVPWAMHENCYYMNMSQSVIIMDWILNFVLKMLKKFSSLLKICKNTFICSDVMYLPITGDLQLEFISEDWKSFMCLLIIEQG
jgi:hypothetical protein